MIIPSIFQGTKSKITTHGRDGDTPNWGDLGVLWGKEGRPCGDLNGGPVDRGAAGAARRCLTGVGFNSYRSAETEIEGSRHSRSA